MRVSLSLTVLSLPISPSLLRSLPSHDTNLSHTSKSLLHFASLTFQRLYFFPCALSVFSTYVLSLCYLPMFSSCSLFVLSLSIFSPCVLCTRLTQLRSRASSLLLLRFATASPLRAASAAAPGHFVFLARDWPIPTPQRPIRFGGSCANERSLQLQSERIAMVTSLQKYHLVHWSLLHTGSGSRVGKQGIPSLSSPAQGRTPGGPR